MPPKGGNTKKESGRAKKAENEVKKREAVAAEKVGVTFVENPQFHVDCDRGQFNPPSYLQTIIISDLLSLPCISTILQSYNPYILSQCTDTIKLLQLLQERQEAAKWTQGAKADKGADAKAKQEAAAARKAEAARLLAEEEAAISSSKVRKTLDVKRQTLAGQLVETFCN